MKRFFLWPDSAVYDFSLPIAPRGIRFAPLSCSFSFMYIFFQINRWIRGRFAKHSLRNLIL
jgi:hypothetical protein